MSEENVNLIEYSVIDLVNEGFLFFDYAAGVGDAVEKLLAGGVETSFELLGDVSLWVLAVIFVRISGYATEVVYRRNADEDAYVIRSFRDEGDLFPFGVIDLPEISGDLMAEIEELRARDSADSVVVDLEGIADVRFEGVLGDLVGLYAIDAKKDVVKFVGDVHGSVALLGLNWFLSGDTEEIYFDDIKVY